MNHPRQIALHQPDRMAVIMAGSGAGLSYRELVRKTDQFAHCLQAMGLRPGDTIAICLENRPEYFVLCWAAFNLGLYFVPISTRLKRNEITYIISNCDARVFVSSSSMMHQLDDLPGIVPQVQNWLMMEGICDSFQSFEQAIDACPATPLMAASQGAAMMYTSGTTGMPRGVKPPASAAPPTEPPGLLALLSGLYGFSGDTTYLSTGPLYHAAPLKFNLAIQSFGGTSVVMEKFDALLALQAIGQHQVTHSQWVPTMFTRMLRLAPEVRNQFDLSSHRIAIHAAAPCPVELKRQMMEWWGAIIHEYYAGSESIGLCAIGPQEWLQHPGSVGRAVKGELHVLSADLQELPPGETGLVYFANGGEFVYHKDPEKTARARLENGWSTFGDIGYVDESGYLYLTDRRDFVIISGGVNIYPQESENLLMNHPAVADVAVFGIPDEEFGEQVKAVVIVAPHRQAGAALERELIDYCKSTLSSLKCPKSIDFASELPREPTGKLLKRVLQAEYRRRATSENSSPIT